MVPLREVFGVVRIIVTESRMVVIRAWVGGFGELLCKGYRVLLWGDGILLLLELDSGSGCTLINLLCQ